MAVGSACASVLQSQTLHSSSDARRASARAAPAAHAQRERPAAGIRRRRGRLNNLPPKAIERLQDMPPDKQEQFLQNNQRFQNLPPDQQAQIRQRLQAWNRLTPAQQQDLRERQQVWEQMTPAQQRRCSPDSASALAAIAAAAPPGHHAATAFAARSERTRPPGQAQRSRHLSKV